MIDDERENPPLIKLEVINNIGVNEQVVEQAQKAAVAVWKKHYPDEEATIHIGFYTQIVDEDGKTAERISEYDPNSDQIHHGIENIQNHMLKPLYDLDQKKFFFLITAHETMHKVQIKRGDKIEGDPTLFNPQQALDYADSIHEDEAWQEAFEALSNEYPDFSMDINIYVADGAKTYMTSRRRLQLEMKKTKNRD